MARRVFCLVESVALALARITDKEHSQELLGILSADLSQTMITDANMNQITARINRFRYEKEEALAQVMGLGLDWEDKPEKKKKLQTFLDDYNFDGNLSVKQGSLKRQIKFLSNLSRSISELRHIRK